MIKDLLEIFEKHLGKEPCARCILILLLIRRFSDVFENEVHRIMDEDGHIKEIAQFYCFHSTFALPDEARLNNILEQKTELGLALNKALKLVEEYNKELKGKLPAPHALWPDDESMKTALTVLDKGVLNLQTVLVEIQDIYPIKDKNLEFYNIVFSDKFKLN